MAMKTLTVIATLFFLVSCARADLQNDLRCREIAFSQSVENKNLELFKSFIDSDARFAGKSVLKGPNEIASAWQLFFSDDGPAIMWRPKFVEILEDGTLALTRGPYRMNTTDTDGNAVEQWGTFNSVWRKNADGKWRVVFDAGSDAREPPDEATQELFRQDDNC